MTSKNEKSFDFKIKQGFKFLFEYGLSK